MDLIITILPVVTKDIPISPRFTPYNFLSRCKFSTLTSRQPMVEFYLLTFPCFPLRKKEHKSYFGKNRTHDFRTSRCAAYLLDHLGDELLQQGNVHPRHTADTWYAASAAVLFPDAVVSFDGALRSGTAVERVGSPSWLMGWTAVVVVLAAAVVAVQVTVAAAGAMGVTAAAAMGVTAAATAVAAHRDHRLGACPSACLSACIVHGCHLQSPLRRCLYGQRLAHGGKRPS